MSKPAQVAVFYLRKDTATFDMSYYLATHMPLVSKAWKPYGLFSYKVTEFGPESPYSVGCVMDFESIAAYQNATAAPEAAEVMSDIKNYSSEQPIIAAGEVVASS